MHGTRGMDTILATHIQHHGLGHGAARTTIREREHTHGCKLLAARRAFNHVLHGGGWGPPPTTSLTKRDVAVYEGRFGRSLTLRRDYNRQMLRGNNRQVLRGGASGSKRPRDELREEKAEKRLFVDGSMEATDIVDDLLPDIPAPTKRAELSLEVRKAKKMISTGVNIWTSRVHSLVTSGKQTWSFGSG